MRKQPSRAAKNRSLGWKAQSSEMTGPGRKRAMVSKGAAPRAPYQTRKSGR